MDVSEYDDDNDPSRKKLQIRQGGVCIFIHNTLSYNEALNSRYCVSTDDNETISIVISKIFLDKTYVQFVT